MRRLVVSILAMVALGSASTSVLAQGVDRSRHHAEPPLRDLFPEALPAPPTPQELGKESSGEPSWASAPDGGYDVDGLVFSAHVDAEGRVTIRDKGIEGNLIITPLFVAFAGIVDFTDLVSRMLGEDPYWYRKKAFLESTFGERLAMRRDNAEVTMIKALANLPAYLEAVWTYPGFSLDQRKKILFALWDECAEDGNELMRQGGAEARNLIVGFIQSRVPPNSREAYSPTEIAALNAVRTANYSFAPYSPAPPIATSLIAKRQERLAGQELAVAPAAAWQLGISRYTHSDDEYCHRRSMRFLDR